MINWNATPDELELFSHIADRAVAMARAHGFEYNRIDASMDINAVHCNGTPLRLRALLESSDSDFAHDVFGIRQHINRNTGTLDGVFVPRYQKNDMDEPTNEQRAARIEPTLLAYAEAMGDGNGLPDESSIRDMLTDLMHYCRSNNINFAYELSTATLNFEAEI